MTKPYWDACRNHRFVLPKCNSCDKYFFPPEVVCLHCWSKDWEWETASGQASLYSYSVVYRGAGPEFETPYILAAIRTEEGCDLFSHLVDCEAKDIRIDMPLSVTFRENRDGQVLPVFKPKM